MPLPIEKLIDGRLSELDLRWPELIARLGYKNISRGLPSLGLSGPRQEIFPLVIMRRVYSLAVSPSPTRPMAYFRCRADNGACPVLALFNGIHRGEVTPPELPVNPKRIRTSVGFS